MADNGPGVTRALGCGGFLLLTVGLVAAAVVTVVLMVGSGTPPTRYVAASHRAGSAGDRTTRRTGTSTGTGTGTGNVARPSRSPSSGQSPAPTGGSVPSGGAPTHLGPTTTTSLPASTGAGASGNPTRTTAPASPVLGASSAYRPGEPCPATDAGQSVVVGVIRLQCTTNGGITIWVAQKP